SDGLALGNEALNGILISLLMRRIDSIVKNYAFSASIFTTAALSAGLLQHWPGWHFYLGDGVQYSWRVEARLDHGQVLISGPRLAKFGALPGGGAARADLHGTWVAALRCSIVAHVATAGNQF
ncbi:unnamed protein product, partial [Effrenium voratum]